MVCLASIYGTLNGHGASREFLRTAVRRFPANADLLECYGMELMHAGREEGAEECWRRVLEEHPRRPVSLSSLGLLHARRGDTERARILLERAVESGDAPMALWESLIRFLRESGNMDAADTHATTWAESHPEHWRAWLCLADVRFERGDAEAAAFAIRRADELKGTQDIDCEADRLLLRILHPEDHAIYERAMTADTAEETPTPDGSYPESLRALTALAQRHRSSALLWFSLSARYAAAGFADSATKAQTQALEIVPGSATGQNTLGVLLALSGETGQALPPLREATRLAPGDQDYRLNLVEALLAEKRLLEAEQHLDWLEVNVPGGERLAILTQRLADLKAMPDAPVRREDNSDTSPHGQGVLRRLVERLRPTSGGS